MCLVLNSAAFRSVGGFDERFFMYCEDTDLCLRMQLAGWRVRYVSDVQVVHAARRHSHRTVRYMVWHVASLMRLWTSGVFWSYLLRRRKLVPLRQSALNRQQLQGPSDS
jgi:hypothetical protein